MMLARTKSVEIGEDDMSVSSLNLGQVCAWYGMKHLRMEMVVASLTLTSRVGAVLDVIAASTEFSSLVMRGGEGEELGALQELVPIKISDAYHVDPHGQDTIVVAGSLCLVFP